MLSAVGYGVNGGVEAEFRGTNSGLVTKARSLDNLFTSLERLAATLSSVLSWRNASRRYLCVVMSLFYCYCSIFSYVCT